MIAAIVATRAQPMLVERGRRLRTPQLLVAQATIMKASGSATTATSGGPVQGSRMLETNQARASDEDGHSHSGRLNTEGGSGADGRMPGREP